MERAYGGWGAAARRGWNWDTWFADWNAMLSAHAAQRLELATAFAPMKQFMAFQLDNHTTIPLAGPRFGSGSRPRSSTARQGTPCTEIRIAGGAQLRLDTGDPAQRPRRATHWNSSAQQARAGHLLQFPAGPRCADVDPLRQRLARRRRRPGCRRMSTT